MTKQEFVDRVAARTELNQRDAAKAVDAMLDSITDTLRRGDAVSFIGFGKFSVADRSARNGVNPATRERMHIPATQVPKFTAGSALKQAIRF